MSSVMKHNLYLTIWFALVGIIVCLSTVSCNKHSDIIPVLEGRPAGGVLRVQVTGYSGNAANVFVDLFATNQFGTLLSNLETSSFDLQNNNSYQGSWINLARKDNVSKGPYSAMLLFDQSGSINSTDPNDARVAAGRTFVEALGADDEIGLAAFAYSSSYYPDDMTILSGFSRDKGALSTHVESLAGKANGETPLYASIYALLPYIAANATNSNKALVVFTDGEDNRPGASVNQIIAAANTYGIEIYVIGLSDAVDNEDLSDIALGTGGGLMWATDAAQLIALYNTLSDLLKGRGQYYEANIQVTKKTGNWFPGESVLYYIRLPFPGGLTVEYPIRIRIP